MATNKPLSLRELQRMFFTIYWKKNKRDYDKKDFLLRIQEEAAKIDEGVRKESKEEIIQALPRFCAWFLSFCNIAGFDLAEVVWEKYHGICPYCGQAENCMCITLETKPSVWRANLNGTAPATLNEWQEMFRKIYGRINKTSMVVQLWLHIHEELGEFSREFRLGNIKKSQEELADCFAQLIGFCNRLDIKLGDIIWRVYPGICDVCHQTKCRCPKV